MNEPDATLTLKMGADGLAPELIMRITPTFRFGERNPSLYVEVSFEEPETGNVRIKNVHVLEYDYQKYNWLGMLRLILSQFDEYDVKNHYEMTPPEHMTGPPRTRWFPPLGEWRAIARRQLGR